ncbi:hypothetical protein [Peptacetobacter sp.]|uniref:hypothetical protein n=1 Tax=Peptacetobacter sp. TaxID=2991975 RepID=UPI00260EA324|nr:hypothetical protein [Peptacetobacter sp.]
MLSKKSKKIDIFGVITIIVVSITTFCIKENNIKNLPESIIYIGIVIFILGLIYTIMEKKMNLPYFYGKCQSGGSNANSFVVIGLGIGIMGQSIYMEIILLISLILVVLIVRNLIERKYLEKNKQE